MIRVHLTCPVCGNEVEATVSREGGDIVPYGSTTARLPEYLTAEIDNCPSGCEWSDKQIQALDERACEIADEYDPRDEGPDREDED